MAYGSIEFYLGPGFGPSSPSFQRAQMGAFPTILTLPGVGTLGGLFGPSAETLAFQTNVRLCAAIARGEAVPIAPGVDYNSVCRSVAQQALQKLGNDKPRPGIPGFPGSGDIYDLTQRALNPAPFVPVEQGATMGFIDDVLGGLGSIGKSVLTGVGGAVGGAIGQGIQKIIMQINPDTGSMQAMPVQGPAWPPDIARMVQMGLPAAAMSTTPNYFDELLRQCGGYTGACADDFNRRLIAFSNAVNGQASGMAMAMNPTTGSMQLTEAGVVGGLTKLLQNPTVRQIASGLGLALGSEFAVDAASALLGGGGAVAKSGPFLMAWPAGTAYPRSITLRAPDKPEKKFRTTGAPLLSSGDVTAVRRVQKAASRARRGRGRRSSSPRTMMVVAGTRNVCGDCLTAPCACKA